jgi:Skp family chaperone for outer membrane proteins
MTMIRQGVLKVKIVPRAFVWGLSGVLLAVTSVVSHAQTQPSTVPVAVVDIGYIFKNYDGFKQAMEGIKQEVSASDAAFRARAKQIEDKAQQLTVLKSDSPEHKSLVAETASAQAQVQAELTLKRKEFLDKEAQIYYAFYEKVRSEVQAFADNHGIGLVLRFSVDQIDPADRQSVMQGVNRPVVYQRNLNITHDILDRLRRQASSPATARRPATTPATRQRTATPTTRSATRR